MKFTYELGSKDSVMEAAEYLRQAILDAFKNSKELHWPLTANDLDYSPLLPRKLLCFLEYVISGSSTADFSKHVVLSIGQVICRRASNGKYKLPKQILLRSTNRHLYQGKKLVTIISRLGHYESYNYISELDNAMPMVLEDVLSLVTYQIAIGENNEVFHTEWDNRQEKPQMQ